MCDKNPKIAFIVLVYNGMNWIDSCFRSVLNTAYNHFEVIVVDNHSTDGSAAHIKKNFPTVTVIENGKNCGTAAGNNIGIKLALKKGADFVATLNQDIKVTEDWVSRMIEVAESDAKIGILSPLQYDYEGKDLDLYFQKIFRETDYFDDVAANTVKDWYVAPWAIGASMMVKREVFERVGLFDSGYFMFEEDADICRRAVFRGFKIAYVTKSKVFHYHTQLNKEPSLKIKYLQRRNKLIFLLKNPAYPFSYNLKNVFIWTNWNRLFGDCSSALMMKVKVFFHLIYLLPLYYRKYLREKKYACYL